MDHLAIIGAGASGVATLRAMIDRSTFSRITMFDPRPAGLGTAFATPHDWHLCNTSVGTMSVDASNVRGFALWLQKQGGDADVNSFVSRRLFSQYVLASYSEALELAAAAGIEVEYLPEAVGSVATTDQGGVAVKGALGQVIGADAVVLSSGAGQPVIPADVKRYQDHPRFFSSPYSSRFEEYVESHGGARVLVFGSKLSAVDAVKTCLQHGATSVMVSPSGQLPAVRSAMPLRSPFPLTRDAFTELSTSPSIFRHGIATYLNRSGIDLGRPLREQLSIACSAADRLREEIALAEDDANLWQYAIGELIDLANDVWSQFPRRRMLELVAASRGWIDRYVSAIPLPNAWALADALQDGALAIRSMPSHIAHGHDGWRIHWAEGAPDQFDAVVCAAGYSPQPWSMDRQGELQLGTFHGSPLRVSSELQAVTDGAIPQPKIWAVGGSSGSRFPVVNYMRSAAVQAEIAARSMDRHLVRV